MLDNIRGGQGYVILPEAFASLARGRKRMLRERDIGKGGRHEKQRGSQGTIQKAADQG
jgi:hypothetical protein